MGYLVPPSPPRKVGSPTPPPRSTDPFVYLDGRSAYEIECEILSLYNRGGVWNKLRLWWLCFAYNLSVETALNIRQRKYERMKAPTVIDHD